MEMVGHQGPGETLGASINQKTGKTQEKALAVGIIPENIATIDATGYDVL